MKQTADECRRSAEVCLGWAQHAPTDDVRRACVTLAMAWLKAAADGDNQDNDHSPLAPEI
jgi:hypothetical protein